MADSDWLFVKRNKTTGQYKTDEEGGGGGDQKEIYIGSFQIYGSTGIQTQARTNFYTGTPDYFRMIKPSAIPSGYTLYMAVGAIIESSDSNYGQLYINDTKLCQGSTWIGTISTSGFHNHYGKFEISDWFVYDSLPKASRYIDNSGSQYYNFNLRNTDTSKQVEAHAITVFNKLVRTG